MTEALIRHVDVYLDSNSVVNGISGASAGSSEGGSLVRRLRQLLALDWTVTIQHVYKEANRVADGLANMGCNLMENNPYVLFETPPDSVRQYVADDVIRVSTPRLTSV